MTTTPIGTYLAELRATAEACEEDGGRNSPNAEEVWDAFRQEFSPHVALEMLAVIEAAARVIAWWAKDPYTQVEKIDGGNDLCAALDALTQRSRDE